MPPVSGIEQGYSYPINPKFLSLTATPHTQQQSVDRYAQYDLPAESGHNGANQYLHGRGICNTIVVV